MKKETIIELLKKGYSYLIEKGMKSTVAKVIIGVLFGIICAFYFSSCSVNYSDNEQKFEMQLTPIVERGNK